jgi:hypothetical protein
MVARIHAESQWHPGAIDLQGALRPHDSLLSRLPRLLGDFLAGDERTVEADQGAIEALALREKDQEGAPDAQVGFLSLTPNSVLRGACHAAQQQSPLSLRKAGGGWG